MAGFAGAYNWAHPRACGENSHRRWYQAVMSGSSPRVRGKLLQGLDHLRRARLIPARAGKTALDNLALAHRRAHPRACGENAQVYNDILPGGGSSPRVRGKQDMGRDVPVGNRLIPARAGKTTRRLRRPHQGAAHPRACGENASDRSTSPSARGSSPRVRGKRVLGAEEAVRARLIPARAGKTRAGW